jgi:hypothetical protein
MNQRRFLVASGFAASLPVSIHAQQPALRPKGGTLLTVAGAVSRSNRGALDPALDQLLAKHGAKFEKAFAFDVAMLAKLPAVSIRPTLEYDAKPHALSGPLLISVLEAAGVAPGANPMLALRALDGYTIGLSLADARSHRMIVATTLDGQPLALGGLGPLWAVYDADRLPAFKDKPLKERFALCPWGLYYIDVRAS